MWKAPAGSSLYGLCSGHLGIVTLNVISTKHIISWNHETIWVNHTLIFVAKKADIEIIN